MFASLELVAPPSNFYCRLNCARRILIYTERVDKTQGIDQRLAAATVDLQVPSRLLLRERVYAADLELTQH